jgi:hypothetical protein
LLHEKEQQVENIENGVTVFDKIEHECSEEIEKLHKEIALTE